MHPNVVFLVFCLLLLIRMHTPFSKWDFMIAIVRLMCFICPEFHISTVSVHVFVTHCISVEHWKQAHHCWVRGHVSGESRQKAGRAGGMWTQP